MKTLNQYYDDSMGRAYIEVPDDEGRETRTLLDNFSHGCKSDACQGVNPVDYDGSPLNNTADVTSLPSQRLIGKGAVNSPSRGTAEPEMRGLYILLTMNNDGGMEVMRYTAVLYRERPEIYHSKPVQLALDIFKVSALRRVPPPSLKMLFLFIPWLPSHPLTGEERPQLRSVFQDIERPCDPLPFCLSNGEPYSGLSAGFIHSELTKLSLV
jgi:hypothetical protein